MQPKPLHHVAQTVQTGLLWKSSSAVKEQYSCKHISWNKQKSVWAECSDQLTHLSQHISLGSPAPFWFVIWRVYITRATNRQKSVRRKAIKRYVEIKGNVYMCVLMYVNLHYLIPFACKAKINCDWLKAVTLTYLWSSVCCHRVTACTKYT